MRLPSASLIWLTATLVAIRGSPGHDVHSPVQSHPLRLRGGTGVHADASEQWDGVGAPSDIGAPGYLETERVAFDRPPIMQTGKIERPSLIDVPGTYDNMTHAVESMDEREQTLLVRSGDHRWADVLATPRLLNMTMHVRGEIRARLLGRWQLYSAPRLHASSCGSFERLTCAYATDDYSSAGNFLPHALFGIMGGPWFFDACDLRAATADVLACYCAAVVEARGCCIGGMGRHDIRNGSLLAVGGVHCADEAFVSVLQSSVEYCGRFCASAIEAREEARLRFVDSVLHSNLIGAKVDGAGNLTLTNSRMNCNYFCQMLAGSNASMASLVCENTTIRKGPEPGQSPIWLPMSSTRPGFLNLEGLIQEVQGDGGGLGDGNDSDTEPTWEEVWEGLKDLPEEEWEKRPDLVRTDVARELVRLAMDEYSTSDSEEQLRRILTRVEEEVAEVEAEEAAVELAPPYEQPSDDVLVLSSVPPSPSDSEVPDNDSEVHHDEGSSEGSASDPTSTPSGRNSSN